MNWKIKEINGLKLGFVALFVWLFCMGNVGKAQVLREGAVWSLGAPLSGSWIYTARDYIDLTSGFDYTSTNINGVENGLELKANENLLLPTNYLTNPISAETRNLDLDLTVGSTAGSFNVSLDGAATYSIPIAVPPGTNGMVPSVSVNYNSMGGNGLLGMGFNLNASSSISRCSENLFNDGEVKGITFGATDKFMLDGQRLIAINGVYGADGTEYRTETEGFCKIVSYGSVGDGTEKGPVMFKVWTKDGKMMEYGFTEDSRIEAQGKTDVLSWKINKILDENENYISFTYVENNADGESRLTQIDYTGNAAQNLNPYNTVKFLYENRIDQNTLYVAGTKMKQSVLLKYIRTYAESNIVREYKFNYTKDVYTHLNEVVEYAGEGETKLNSTVFSWGANTITYTKNAANIPHTTKESNYTGDFNGDGKQDLIKVTTYNNTFTLFYYNTSTNNFVAQQTFSLDSDFNKFITADFDADGITELLLLRKSSYNSSLIKYNTNINDFLTLHNFVGGYMVKYGDFNGDGSTDIKIGDKLAGYSLKSNGNWEWDEGFITNITGGTSSIFGGDMAFDYNGDGKAELEVNSGHRGMGSLVKTASGTYIFEQNMLLPMINSMTCAIKTIISQGDFNGDGKMDIIFFDNEDKKKIGISTGKTFEIKNAPIPEDQINENPPALFYPVVNDFDGDGKSDIMIAALVYRIEIVPGHDDKYFPDHDSIIGIHYGDGLAYQQLPIALGDYAPWYKEQINTDFNGDGKDDFCDGIDILTFNPFAKNQMITTIANGLNTKTKISYKNLTDNTVYTKGTGASYPMVNVASPYNVVWKVELDDGVVMDGYGMSSEYFYTDAKTHLGGRSYMGFASVSNTNTSTGQRQLSTFEINNPYYFPVLKKTEIFSGGSLLSQTINTNAVKEFGNTVPGTNRKERILPYVSESVSINELLGTSVSSNYTYSDDYANLTHTEAVYKKGTTTQWTETGDYTYDNYTSGGKWILGLVKTAITNKTHPNEPGEGSFVSYTNFDYYSNGHLQNKITEPGNANSITENFEYTVFGNVSKTTSTAGGMSRYVTYEYDTKKRFVTKQRNNIGHYTEYEYEAKYGNVTKQRDANGLQTTYTYDVFGTALQRFLPDNTNVSLSTQFVKNMPDAPLNSLYCSSSVSTGNAPVVAFYDRLGKQLRTVAIDVNNNKVYSDKSYDTKYYLSGESLPYFAGGVAQWINYTYDYGTGRLLSKIGAGVNMVFAYSGCTVTITDNIMGTTTSKTTDAAGNIETSIDVGGTITYKYNSMGQVKKIIDNGGNTTTIGYDPVFGRKTSMQEPDAGPISYAYNAFGELTQQNSSKGSISLTYDNIGRVQTQTESEGTTTYTYDANVHGMGLLSSVTCTNGYAKAFTYDALNRPATETETIDGTPYTMSYTYNNNGKLNSMSYPNNYMVSYVYKPDNGNLYQVKKPDNTPLWTLSSSNQFGAPMDVNLGNNLTTHYTYTNLGMVNYINTENQNNVAVQTLEYWYNNKQQLTGREDSKNGVNETFTYDNLNRLTSSTVNGQDPISINYNSMGNITSKTGVGDYSYTGAQPHGVTGVTNPVGMISTNPQVINYTSFNKVSSISENNNELTISYGAGKQRIKSVLKQGKAITKTKYFAFDGAYEKIIDNTTGITKELCYLPGVKGYAAIYEKNTTTQTGQLHYIHRDHQGSIQSITNESGIVEEELNFDAWGNRRNAANWTYNNVPTSFMFDRGYTGHEHLDIFSLINMNGRVYDPKLGRMLSPDLIVQSPDFTQSYNRYSYCMNNPLMFTDPSGYEQLPDGYEGNFGDGRHGTPFNFNVSLPVNYNGGNIWGGGVGNSGVCNYGRETYGAGPSFAEYQQYLNAIGTPNAYNSANWNALNIFWNSNDRIVNGGYWIQFGKSERGWDLPDNQGNEVNVTVVVNAWITSHKINTTTSGGDGRTTNYGLYVTGVALTFEDLYNNFVHNHTTYKTTKVGVKNIYKSNGMVRSSRAATFASASKVVKFVGTVGTGLMTGMGAYNIATGNGTILDVSDVTVGTAGLIGTGLSYCGYAVPGIGQGVALYSWGRFWFDMGQEYGPSTWYGEDDNKWYK